jgi:hypothetical protein
MKNWILRRFRLWSATLVVSGVLGGCSENDQPAVVRRSPQDSPEGTYEAFRSAFAAKNPAAIATYSWADDETKVELLKRFNNVPQLYVDQMSTARLLGTRIDGDKAVGVVEMTSQGKKRYEEQLFMRQDGTWFVVKGTLGVNPDDFKALRAWYAAQRETLEAADRK